MSIIQPKFLKIKSDYVCPLCGNQENLSIPVDDKEFNKSGEFYECRCGWSGDWLITKGEWLNIKRTKLIDKML